MSTAFSWWWSSLLDATEFITASVTYRSLSLLPSFSDGGEQHGSILFANLVTITAYISLFLWNLPFAILYFGGPTLDRYFDRYLIQPKRKKERTPEAWLEAIVWLILLLGLLWSILVFGRIASIILYFRPEFDLTISSISQPDKLPGVGALVIDLLKCQILEDSIFYWLHRLFHHPYLYAAIHKAHHKYKAPFSLTATSTTAIDFIIGDSLPLTLAVMFGARHLSTAMAFVSYRLFLTTEIHSGYTFPWSLDHILDNYLGLPFYAGSKHHDKHHEKTHGNYSSSLYFWDFVLGTTIKGE